MILDSLVRRDTRLFFYRNFLCTCFSIPQPSVGTIIILFYRAVGLCVVYHKGGINCVDLDGNNTQVLVEYGQLGAEEF